MIVIIILFSRCSFDQADGAVSTAAPVADGAVSTAAPVADGAVSTAIPAATASSTD